MLRRNLSERYAIYTDCDFPKRVAAHKRFPYRAWIGVGGNVGDTKRRFRKLWVYLSRSALVEPLATGVILRNPPFGFTDQDDFDNTLIEIATSLTPRALLRLLWRIEKHFGRVRSFPNAPRTLDLDIIFYDNRAVRYAELIIPHPHWSERPSVTIPLGSLPRNGKTVRRRYENLDF